MATQEDINRLSAGVKKAMAEGKTDVARQLGMKLREITATVPQAAVNEASQGAPQQTSPSEEKGLLRKVLEYSPGAIAGETGLMIGSGALGQIAGGLAGLGTTLMEGPDAGARVVNDVANAMTYQPRTEGGQMAAQYLGKIGNIADAITDASGEGAVVLSSMIPGVEMSPETAGAAYAAGSIVPALASMAVGGPSVGSLSRRSSTGEGAQLRQAIINDEAAGAGYKLSPKGAVIKDLVAQEAAKHGFDERVIAAIKSSSPEDKAAMLKMLNMGDMSLKNSTFAARYRPSDVIGDSVMARWNKVYHENRKALAESGRAAREELKGKTIDISDEAGRFIDDLEDMGVGFKQDGSLDFTGSQIEGNPAAAPIRRIYQRIKTKDDGYNLHQLKQYIDRQIDWNKSPDRPLDAQAVSVMKQLRGRINDRLRENSESYAKANDVASETFGALKPIADVMGRRFDPEAEGAGALVGQEMRNVLSNYSKRQPLTYAVDNLDAVARKYGAKFNNDPIKQVVFFNELERMFGSFAPRSFRSEVGAGVTDAANVLMSGDPTTAVAKTAVSKVINRFNKKTPENAIKAMRDLLSQ